MSRGRPPQPLEVRLGVVRRVREGEPVSKLSEEMGISVQTVRNWIRPESCKRIAMETIKTVL
ncbi:hypothetical protein BH24ACT22_BH24ACT22_02760 [soil metagenome]